jgi:hypothetical protein
MVVRNWMGWRLLAVAGAMACSRAAVAPKPAAATDGGASKTAAAAQAVVGSGASSSEQIATNRPEPGCKDCQQGDATNGPTYFGKPEGKLDDKTVAELQAVLDQNDALVEGGIAILEKHTKAPDKALVEMDKYVADNIHAIEAAHRKAAEMRARLKAVGFDQDVPEQIRPAFEAKMAKMSERLERLRETYATRRDVLQSFGKLFARGK